MSEETQCTKIEVDTNVNTDTSVSNANAEDSEKIKYTEPSASTSNAASDPLVNPHQNQSAEILNLVTDCFEELFEYFPLKDILCMGGTCKRLHQIVLYILQQYYSGAEILIPTANDLRIGNVDEINVCIKFIDVAHRVSVYCNNGLSYLNQIQSRFRRLRHIHINGAPLNRQNTNGLKAIFEKLEVLQISMSEMSGSVHEAILAFCPNIKRLGLMDWKVEEDMNELDLFHHKYPSLEHFELILSREKHWLRHINGLKGFLKLNPNIRSLSISSMNSKELLPDSADIHLDELAFSVIDAIDVEFVRMIKELHKRGFYQRLKLYCTNAELIQDNIDQLATLEGLSKLCLRGATCKHSIAISALSSLTELYFYECDRIADLESAAINLSMLGRIHFKYASLDDIWPFIQQARRVTRIKVDNLMEGIHFSIRNSVINLVALNKEREKLAHAQKMTIYVKEKVYLATKWTMKEMDLRMIRLKREEAYEWIHDFEGFLT